MSSHLECARDFRSFVRALKEDNDLVEIDEECDPNLEVGAVIRKAVESDGQAPLFNKLKGQNENGLWRILGAPCSLRADSKQKFGRLARHVGLQPDAHIKTIMDRMQAAKAATPIPPQIVQTGPCKELRLTADQIDLNALPAPLLHQADGGKYLQTYGMNVVQSPDGKWVNWSVNRGMVHDGNHITQLLSKSGSIWQIFQMWRKEGKDMPWALVFGAPPAAILAASMPLPDGMSEVDYVGSLTGSPVQVVKCETNDIFVPANSEIVFEGYCSITETVPEGPFGEMHGYLFPGAVDRPSFKVDLITYRENAIMPVCCSGRLTDETQSLGAPVVVAEISSQLKPYDLPITDIWCPLESQATWLALRVDTDKLRALKTTPKEFCRKMGDIVFQTTAARPFHRILLVGEDINVYDFRDILWAFCTRCRPGLDEHPFDDVPGYPLVPFMSQGGGNPLVGGKVVSDCLFPVEYTTGKDWEVADFKNSFPPEIQAKVLDNWELYGYKS
ncbi:ferulic acid decarboxylase 1 [Trichoderma arundinaceum]|uniref:Ferulic acid decarboxylase 1 n=1 Tax=Trichoderma arundinaceum TaxID=490622 RepID=A0A395NMJ4_TRIAR|nr:ferulic acid decarboxylase 1 [Trichoderma arundinaceum]